jgi:hypothetical protein
MAPDVSKLLLIAAAVTVLVGLAATHYRRGLGAVIALAGLSAIGAGLATQLLFPDFFFGTNDPEAKLGRIDMILSNETCKYLGRRNLPPAGP